MKLRNRSESKRRKQQARSRKRTLREELAAVLRYERMMERKTEAAAKELEGAAQ